MPGTAVLLCVCVEGAGRGGMEDSIFPYSSSANMMGKFGLWDNSHVSEEILASEDFEGQHKRLPFFIHSSSIKGNSTSYETGSGWVKNNLKVIV